MCAARSRRTADWQGANVRTQRKRGRRMTPAPSGPTHRRQLGAELRRLRTAAGLTTEQVGAELKCSHTRVSRIETAKGRVAVKPADIQAMCKLYGVTDERQISMLLDMLT